MGRLVVVEFLTLDGVMQSLGSPEEDTEGGFRHGGWSAPYSTPEQGAAAGEAMASTGAYLFGRRTFEKMAQFWPHAPAENPMAAHLNATPKYVVSATLGRPAWTPTTVIRHDVPECVAALKSRHGGDVAVLGSGLLVQTLARHDLVDRYHLFLHPLVLGSGKRLFREYDDPQRLHLVQHSATSTGVLLLSYEVVRD